MLSVTRPAAFCAALFLGSTASAATQDFSFTGMFSGDADVQLFNFTIGATSDVRLRSYSYAGGVMADGTVVPAGGFDPILALWDGSGNLIQEYDDGPEDVPSDPGTGRDYDTNLLLTALEAGSYTASIAQYDNFAAGSTLSAGFSLTDPFFTASEGCSNGQFCDVTGANRTSFWAFDVLGVDSVEAPDLTDPEIDTPVVPLPAGLPMLLSALAAAGLVARRRTSA